MKIQDIFSDLPNLETERLILRKITIQDAAEMYEYSSVPQVYEYVPWETHKTIEDSMGFIEYVLKQYESGHLAPWAIELKAEKKMIGTIDFVSRSPSHYTAEMGFILSKTYWGKGLIKEAAGMVMEFGLEKMDLNRIEASCMSENVQSKRVPHKLGMKLEGISREKHFIKGKFRDMANYALLKSEFEG
ncbi:MAG TPA: GNAT family protein [Bacillaceae bacterium]